jgi:hypothetical protein
VLWHVCRHCCLCCYCYSTREEAESAGLLHGKRNISAFDVEFDIEDDELLDWQKHAAQQRWALLRHAPSANLLLAGMDTWHSIQQDMQQQCSGAEKQCKMQ